MASKDSYCDFNLNGGKLLQAGFEEVNVLPTINLFAGRQVTYNGQLYVYNGSQWVNVNAPYEANLQWGGRNITKGFSPIDASLNNFLSANRFALYNSDDIVLEYSTDGGANWLEYINNDKIYGTYTTYSPLLNISKYTDRQDVTTQCQLRAVFKSNSYIYTELNKFMIYVGTNGTSGCWVTLSVVNQDDTITTLISKQPIDGWSNWNILNLDKNIRIGVGRVLPCVKSIVFTFGYDGTYNTAINGLTIYSIFAYGGPCYNVSNDKYNIQYNSTIYTIGKDMSATFPAAVKSTETVNFDVNIKPTQTGTVAKMSGWLWQYYAQSIAWLMNNHLPLSGGTLSGDINAPRFIVPNGTASQFLKADGSLDSNAYALHADLNSVKNNAWQLDTANPECETVVITLQQGQGIFEAMEKAGIDYSKSRNIYVDLSAAGEWSGENIFAGYEKASIGVRYHIFFGNVKTAIKLYWASSIESNKLSGNPALTAEYPTAKCEFMRVTDSWTYADWEALIDEVSHVIDTGTASESDNSTLMNYMDNNKVSYTKTPKGALVNITALLAALAGNK